MKNKSATLVYQIVGEGTTALAELKPGDGIKTILPIGKGFHLNSAQKDIVLVGGGVGIAPLYSVTQRWPNKNYDAYLGYRGEEFAYCINEFRTECSYVCITSNDGTVGEKGFITDALSKRLKDRKPDVILACGPIPMLKLLKEVACDIPVQVSMEQRMGCGFGACSTCVCGINSKDGLEYKKVCIDGPVFDLAEVEL